MELSPADLYLMNRPTKKRPLRDTGSTQRTLPTELLLRSPDLTMIDAGTYHPWKFECRWCRKRLSVYL